jgi:hypothetical protein
MEETRVSKGIIALSLWTALLAVIVVLVVWTEYKSDHIGTWIALCAGGFVFWSVGLILFGPSAPVGKQRECAGTEEQSGLREFYLNGYFFQPYEQETTPGQRQFRLLSMPKISPDKEAAIIRYLINEGLSETFWPQISRRIEEEASWAFFA